MGHVLSGKFGILFPEAYNPIAKEYLWNIFRSRKRTSSNGIYVDRHSGKPPFDILRTLGGVLMPNVFQWRALL